MRRGSLVGPLLLIGIGGLFLARNIVPDLPLLDYLAQYWPFLLILWGALRLLEIAIWAVQSKPLPRFGVSGGEWILVVFLCMFGLSLHAVRGFTSWLPRAGFEWGGLEVFGESFEYPLSAEAATVAAPRIVIEGFRGSARIVAGDGNTIKVSGHQNIRSMDQATADRTGKDSKVEVINESSQVIIRVTQPTGTEFGNQRGPVSRRISADLDITVPRGASIVATNRDGDFDISGIAGSVDINGNNSSVRLEGIGGEVRLEVQSSDIVRAVNIKGSLELKGRGDDIDFEKIAGQVTVDGSWGGLIQFRELAKPIRWKGPQTEITAQALPGELRMTVGDISASKVTGPLRIESNTKDIELTDVTGATTLDMQRGDVRLNATTVPLHDISIRLNAGNVELSLPENAKFNMNAVTQRGEAFSDYGDGVRQDSNGRRGASITSSAGGATIDVQVNRGELTLRRAGAASTARIAPVAPVAPLPPKALPRPIEQ
ncbi:MAG: DUF4097 family beta strand repeat-containing protein [Bryobacteraceae bacterium]